MPDSPSPRVHKEWDPGAHCYTVGGQSLVGLVAHLIMVGLINDPGDRESVSVVFDNAIAVWRWRCHRAAVDGNIADYEIAKRVRDVLEKLRFTVVGDTQMSS